MLEEMDLVNVVYVLVVWEEMGLIVFSMWFDVIISNVYYIFR